MTPITDPDLLAELESGPSLAPADVAAELDGPPTPVAAQQGSASSDFATRAFRAVMDGAEALDAMRASGVQGATLGFSDEAQAALLAARDTLTGQDGSFSDRFAQYQQSLAAELADVRERFPGTSLASEVAGGFATGGGLVGAATTKIAGAVPRALSAPVAGGAVGGVAGFGATDGDIDARIGGAGTGAAIGSTLGAGIAAGGAVSRATKPARKALARMAERAPTRAQRMVAERLAIDEMTPIQAAQRLRALGPDGVLADVGEGISGLAEDVVQRPIAARRLAQRVTRRRSETAIDRVIAPLEKTLGPGGAVYSTLDEIAAVKRRLAGPLYRAAYQQPTEMTPELRRIFEKSPGVKAAWRRVKVKGEEHAIADDIDLPEGALGDALPSTMGWDFIKRELDRKIGVLKRSGDSDWRSLDKVRRKMLAEIDSQNDQYAQARKIWETGSRAEEAIDSGMKFMKAPAEFTEKELAKMGDTDRALFRIGASRALRDMLERGSDTASVAQKFKNRGIRRKVRVLFDDPADYTDFMNTVRAEGIKKSTENATLGNSKTVRRQEGQDAIGASAAADVAVDVAQGNAGQAARGILGAARGFMSGSRLTDNAANRVGQMLFETDPAKQARIIQDLMNRQAITLPSGLLPSGVPAIAGGVGGVAGLLSGRF